MSRPGLLFLQPEGFPGAEQSDGNSPRHDAPPHTLLLTVRSVHSLHLSVNRGIRPLTAVPGKERHPLEGLCLSTRDFCATPGFFPAESGTAPFIPLSHCIRDQTDDGGLWLIHVTEPVTETIS